MARRRFRPRPGSASSSGRKAAGRSGSLFPGRLLPTNPVTRFVLLFAVLLLAFYALTLTPFAENRAWPAYLEWNADASGMVLRALGQDVTVQDRMVRSPAPGSGLLIERGCDAVHPSGLFLAAVLAAPVALRFKLAAAVIGPLLLMLTNLVRIVSLYFVQIHIPRAFEFLHVEVWQAAFIFLAVLLWIAWARWAVRLGGLVTAA